MLEEKKKFGDVFKDNLQKIIIFFVSALYIAQGVFTIVKRNATIIEVIGAIGLSIVVGIVISTSLNSMGLKDGRKSKQFVASMKLYGETKEKATPYFDKLQSWCDYKNAIDLENGKKDIIQGSGLKWKLYKIGFYEEHKPTDKDQLNALEKASKLKIERLLPQTLLSDLPSAKFMKTRFGQSEQEYKTRDFISGIFSKFLTGIICGLYGLMPLFNQNNYQEVLASVLWNTIQVFMWLAFGMSKYVNARSFIEDEYRQTHLIQKTEYLNEFIITIEKNPDIVKNYDEEEEIKKYLQEIKKEVHINEERKEDVLI